MGDDTWSGRRLCVLYCRPKCRRERERERETRVYAYGRTNKEASIGVVSGIGAEDDRWDEDGRGERSWSGREMKRADERRRERERLTLG